MQNASFAIEQLNQMQSDISTVKVDSSAMKENISELKSDVAVLKTDVTVLKSDVADIKEQIATKLATKDEVNQRFDVVEEEIATLKTDMTIVKSDVKELKYDMAEVKKEMITKDDMKIYHREILNVFDNLTVKYHAGEQENAALFVKTEDLRRVEENHEERIRVIESLLKDQSF